MNRQISNISILGSSTMGNVIAHSCELNRFIIKLIDVSEKILSNAIVTISENLDRQVVIEIISFSEK